MARQSERGVISMKATLLIFAILIGGSLLVSLIATAYWSTTGKTATTANDAANERMRAIAKRQSEQPLAPPSTPVGDTPETISRARRLVTGLEKTGVIARWSCIGNEAYVDNQKWAGANVDEKQLTAFSLAVVCGAEKSGRYITIKGYQSGKPLATYTHRGFEIP